MGNSYRPAPMRWKPSTALRAFSWFLGADLPRDMRDCPENEACKDSPWRTPASQGGEFRQIPPTFFAFSA